MSSFAPEGPLRREKKNEYRCVPSHAESARTIVGSHSQKFTATVRTPTDGLSSMT
jgi:hypothetical protein